MKRFCFNLFFFVFLFSILFNSSFSYLVSSENSNSFFYFVNDSNLDVTLDFKNVATSPLIFASANVETSSGEVFFKEFNEQIDPLSNFTLKFNLNEFISEEEEYFNNSVFEEDGILDLNLLITELNQREYSDDTIPDEVMLLYHRGNVDILENNFVYYKDQKNSIYLSPILRLDEFSHTSDDLISYKIYLNESLIKSEELDKKAIYFQDLINSIYIDFIDNFDFGVYNFEVEIEDVAGIKATVPFTIYVQEGYLDMKILTNKDDSNLKYYTTNSISFGNDYYLNNFKNKIYTSQKSFNLKLETSKPGKCYLSSNSILNTTPINDNLFNTPDYTLTTQDGYLHQLDLSPFGSFNSTYIWIGCEDESGLEKVHLSKSLFGAKSTILLQHLEDSFEMDLLFPEGDILTNGHFNSKIQTNTNGKCFYSYKKGQTITENTYSTQNYLNHTSEVDIVNGNYFANYFCYDLFGNVHNISRNVEVNTDLAIDITFEDDSLYTSTSSVEIKFTTSEIVKTCKYSKRDQDLNGNTYASFSSIGENTNTFSSKITGLQPGLNKFQVLCERESGTLSPTSPVFFEVVYDSVGPQISNLIFVNEGEFKSEKYVANLDKMRFDLDVESIVPIDYFRVEIYSLNTSKDIISEEISASQNDVNYTQRITISENLEGYVSLKVYAYNILGVESKTPVTKEFILDRNLPVVTILDSGNLWKVSCTDLETQKCSKILYSFADSSALCKPSILYNDSIGIDKLEKSYICAKGQDGVGKFSLVNVIETGYIDLDALNNNNQGGGSGGREINFPDENNETQEPITQGNETQEPINQDTEEPEVEDPVEIDPPEYNTDDEDSNLGIVLGAIAFFLVLAGGGGYYAYKKGYLNEQLTKLGVKLPGDTNNNNNSSNDYYSSSPNLKSNTNSKSVPNLVGGKGQKSKYDEHLQKLNSFLDETLNKKKNVFDSFKKSQKGRVDKYEDTLAKGKVDGSKLEIKKQDDFGDFYKASSNNSKLNSNSIEDEADKFEEFYKNRKNKIDEKKKETKK